MTHKYKGFGGFFCSLTNEKDDGWNTNTEFLKMETNEKYILKDLYFFSFE